MNRLQAACLAALLLAACGGGGGGGSNEGNVNTGTGSTGTPTGSLPGPAANCDQQTVTGPARNDGLRIANVQWLQVVGQNNDANTTLRGSKTARLRVDLIANTSRTSPARRELRVQDPATGNCSLLSLSGPSRVPTSVDVSTLANSYTVDIPAASMKPGSRFFLYLDDSTGRSTTELAQVTRTLAPTIANAASETLFVIPIRFAGSNGYAPANDTLTRLLTRLHPIGDVTINTAAAFTPPTALKAAETAAARNGSQYAGTLTEMQNLLSEVDDHCQTLIGRNTRAATAPKCLGVFPDNLTFRPSPTSGSIYSGLAYVGGSTMITQSLTQVDNAGVTSAYQGNHWLADRALTVAHEYGHLLDLDHAGCGGSTTLDLRLYLDGRLGGGNGLDIERNYYFSSAGRNSEFADLMSYCGKEWTSDRGYLASLNYRTPATAARTAARETGGSQWLKLTRTDNGWRLRPVDFAPATLATSEQSLDVFSDRGQERLPLRQAVVGDGPGSQGPYYIDLGDRQLTRLVMPAVGSLPATVWTATDWLRTGG